MPVPVQEGFHEVGQVEGRKLTPSTTVHSLTFPVGRIPGQSHSTNEFVHKQELKPKRSSGGRTEKGIGDEDATHYP